MMKSLQSSNFMLINYDNAINGNTLLKAFKNNAL